MAAVLGRPNRRRAAVVFALEAFVVCAAGYAAFADSSTATGRTDATTIVECRTGVESRGDVRMSALVVARVPPAAFPNTPGDCVASG